MKIDADPSGHVVWGVGLRPLACWDRGFKSHRGTWIFVCCQCCLLSCRGFCDELITRPEEPYRLWCVVCDLETPRMRRPWLALGRIATEKEKERKAIRNSVNTVISWTRNVVLWQSGVFVSYCAAVCFVIKAVIREARKPLVIVLNARYGYGIFMRRARRIILHALSSATKIFMRNKNENVSKLTMRKRFGVLVTPIHSRRRPMTCLWIGHN